MSQQHYYNRYQASSGQNSRDPSIGQGSENYQEIEVLDEASS